MLKNPRIPPLNSSLSVWRLRAVRAQAMAPQRPTSTSMVLRFPALYFSKRARYNPVNPAIPAICALLLKKGMSTELTTKTKALASVLYMISLGAPIFIRIREVRMALNAATT